MPKREQDPAREERIDMEIIVDAYHPEEQALGWYYYLEKNLAFPFTARCVRQRPVSPLEPGDEVEVIGMPPEDECEHEMFVNIRWERRSLAVPLAQLELVRTGSGSGETEQAIADWQYWVDQGRRF